MGKQVSWLSKFNKYSQDKLAPEDWELWNIIKRALVLSEKEYRENLFPSSIVRNVVITLNGRLMYTTVEEKDSLVKYYYALNADDLGATEGNVRLNSVFTKKPFNTGESELLKSFGFMLSFIKRLKVSAFSDDNGFNVDLQRLRGFLSLHNIDVVTVKANPILCTLNLETGDYVLARDHKDDYLNCVSLKSAESSVSKEESLKRSMLLNNLIGFSDSAEYYLTRSVRKTLKNPEFCEFLTLPKGLLDIVPVAFDFPKFMPKVNQSGIIVTSELSNVVFDKLKNDSNLGLNDFNLDLSGEEIQYAEPIKISFLEKLEEFRKSAKTKVFKGPSLSSSADDVVNVICVSRRDILNAFDIRFDNYSFSVMHYLLSCVFDSNVSSVISFSLKRDSRSMFNEMLKVVIKQSGLEFAEPSGR